MTQERLQYALSVLFTYWDWDVVRVIRALQDLLPKDDDRRKMLDLFFTYYDDKIKKLSDTQLAEKARLVKFAQLGLQSFIRELSVKTLQPLYEEKIAFWFKNYDPRPNATLAGSALDMSHFHLQNVEIPEHSLLDDAGKQRYKRLVMQAQDALSMRDFEKAFAVCQQAVEETEPESAQLYELMMIAFFNAQSPENIVFDALQLEKLDKKPRAALLEGAESGSLVNQVTKKLPKLPTLLLLVQRCSRWQAAEKCKSETANENIKKVAQQLFEQLSIAYLNIQFDYAKDTENKDDARREATQRWIETAWLIHEQIATAHEFFEQQFVRLMLEITGGGKFQWLAVAKNQTHQIHDNSDLDALQLFEHIRNWLTLQPIARGDVQHAVQELSAFADQLYFKIYVEKYFGLKVEMQKLDKKKDPKRETELRQKVLDLFDAAEIAFELTKRKDFLDFIVSELTDEGIFSWIDLSKQIKPETRKDLGSSIFENNAISRKMNFNAVGELLRMTEKAGLPQPPIFDRLEIGIAKHIAAQTEQKYLQLMAKINRFLPVKSDERREVWACLKDFEQCYKVLWDEALIKRCLGELTGYGILIWFDVDEKTGKLTSNRATKELKIDAVKEVERLIAEKNPSDLAPLTQTAYPQYVAQKLVDFGKHVLETPDQMQLYNRASMVKIFYDLEHCAAILDDKKPLMLVIDEIVKERRFNWIDLTEHGMTAAPESVALQYDCVKELMRLIEKNGDQNLIKDIRKFVADKHASESMKDYQENVATDRKNNNLRDRERVVDAILQLKNCYLLYQDIRYLQMPLDELSGQGKIEWYRFKFLSHPENKQLDFDVFKEKEQFLNWNKNYFQNQRS
ncbi:MAG: hypothetical protein RL757_51 [Bacteroidota bacterium]|jgi:hypothetical protein